MKIEDEIEKLEREKTTHASIIWRAFVRRALATPDSKGVTKYSKRPGPETRD